MTKRFSALAVSAAIVGGFFITSMPAHAATSADRGEVSVKAAVTCNTSQLRQQIANLKTKAAKLKQLGRPRRPGRRSATRPHSRRGSTRASRLTTKRASRSPDKFPVSMCGAARPVPGMGSATRLSGARAPRGPGPPGGAPAVRAGVPSPGPRPDRLAARQVEDIGCRGLADDEKASGSDDHGGGHDEGAAGGLGDVLAHSAGQPSRPARCNTSAAMFQASSSPR